MIIQFPFLFLPSKQCWNCGSTLDESTSTLCCVGGGEGKVDTNAVLKVRLSFDNDCLNVMKDSTQ